MSNELLDDFLAKASFHFSNARPLIPMYIHLILSALFPIFTGAHASLSRPASAAKPQKKDKKAEDGEDEDEDEDKIQKMEGLSNSDAIVLPVTAGVVLAGLYFLIKWYGAGIINLILGWYFSAVGVYSVAKLVNDGLHVFLGFIFPTFYAGRPSWWKVIGSERKTILQNGDETRSINTPTPLVGWMPLPQGAISALWGLRGHCKQKYTVKAYAKTIFDLTANLTLVNVLSAYVGLGTIIYVNTVSKLWFLTNLQGFAVSYSALQLMSPTTFATGSLILGALFCYDIWAVFFTPLMVTVAKNLDVPIKLVFPRPDEPGKEPGEPPIKSFSMLGLGDIVLPGIMIGLALRFDLYLFYLRKQKKVKKSVAHSAGQSTSEEVTEKAPYVAATGHWGDRFWTLGIPTHMLPPQLKSSFPKPYFTASIIGYVIGMLTTLGVMSVFQHAQPALLYLVPGVLTGVWGMALVRGEIKEMWEFTEAVTGEQLAEGEDEKKDGGTKAGATDEKNVKGLFERLWSEIWGGSKDDAKPKSASGNSSSNSKGAKTQQKEKDEDERKDDRLLMSFSITLFDPKTAAETKSRKGIVDREENDSAVGSEGSDDAVVVSTADLDGTHESESAPRHRTRSTRTGAEAAH